ncbi:PrgI family protein [Oceanobacillus luteolus]|uniref:PrgI family protein n=1 Tax=Oceanobacillus luteolus TaxID=1274358 RepID=A0ABW4HVT1_9BACI
MARKVTVPIDMSSEQKVILGIISKRQLIYLIVGGMLLYFYVPKVYGLVNDPLIGIIFAMFSALPTAILVLLLGFMKHHKHSLNFDKYFLIKLRYRSQLGAWRKGPAVSTNEQLPAKKKERK